MGIKNTVTKTRDCLTSFRFDHIYRQYNIKIYLLKDGRIICFDYLYKDIRIYKIIDNNLSLDSKFCIEYDGDKKDRGPCIMNEIEDNILLFGAYKEINLIEKTNFDFLQKIKMNYNSYINNILKLSNGLIAVNNLNKITFYIYDKNDMKLEKKDEFTPLRDVYEMIEVSNGNLLLCSSNITIYNINSKEDKEIELINKDKYEKGLTHVVDNYLFISYFVKDNNDNFKNYLDIFEINLDNFKLELHQSLIIDYPYNLIKSIKLNAHKLISIDNMGNIYEFNISDNFKISLTDVFKAHEKQITSLCKITDNKIITSSQEGTIKLWEFN